jgi:hypothetical protein
MRSLCVALLFCVSCLVVGIGPASADNTIIVVQPNPYAQAFTDNLKHSQNATAQAGQGLGQLLGAAFRPKDITSLTVILKCNRYHLIEVNYRDGSFKVIDDPRGAPDRNEAVDRDKLKAMAATVPGFTWSELPCEE